MKKRMTKIWMAVGIWGVSIAGMQPFHSDKIVRAEGLELPWEEGDPYASDPYSLDDPYAGEAPYEEEYVPYGGDYYAGGEEEYDDWQVFEEEYSEEDLSDDLGLLWSFDESELEGADPKRADLLEENEGKKVTLEKNTADEIWIGVYPLAQYPDFPTGCEVTSLTMVLNYEGFDVTIGEIADEYLEKGEPASESYREIFWGDPRSPEAFGCFAPVLVNAANKYLEEQKSEKRAIDLSGADFEELYEELRYGYPVIVWGSMYIDQDIVEIGSWEIDGETVTWPGNEHCMVLTGFDLENDTVRVCDPLRGIMVYDRESFESHYLQMEKQAIVIRTPEEESALPIILPIE